METFPFGLPEISPIYPTRTDLFQSFQCTIFLIYIFSYFILFNIINFQAMFLLDTALYSLINVY